MALPPGAMPMPGASPPAGGAPIAPASRNPGSEASAMSKVQAAVKVLQEASNGLDPGSDAGQAVLDAIKKLSKLPQVAQAAPGVGAEQLRMLAQRAQQQAPLLALLRQQAAGGGAPGGGAAPGGAPDPAAMGAA